MPNVLFGFCYTPPSDSPYFDMSLLSKIQEKVNSSVAGCVVMGNLNARFDVGVRDLPI